MNHTVEEVRAEATEISDLGGTQAGIMLNAYADMLEQQAKGVTGEVVATARDAYRASFDPENMAPMEQQKVEAMRAALQSVAHLLPSGERDAYEGAREDLLDWKHRALSAESILRSLGYKGLVANEPPAQAAHVDAPVGYGLWHCKDKRLGGFVYSTEQAATLQCSPGYKVIRLSTPAPDGSDFCPHGREWTEYCYDEPCNRDAQLDGGDMTESYVCLKCGHQPTKLELTAKRCPNCDATSPTAEPVAQGEAFKGDELVEFIKTVAAFEDGVDSDAGQWRLMQWAEMGLLECVRFEVTSKGKALAAGESP